ncbi:hypothetical protein RJ640_002818 [Escallonia rubra]|uniref:Protein kinase domain-containing protein n=1 Tax=Escallonia rubra TaxID=112253 RepID=A0AA88U110_9ASTE|nr:hypothetical protein RJ640_002818 [Escallonia rubra]
MAAVVYLALILSFSAVSAVTNITTDEHALLSLKAPIASWSSSVTQVCNWTGVLCNRHGRVAALNLSNMGLLGTIAPDIGNLSFIVSLDLSNNNFSGGIPKEMAHLRRFKDIHVNFNDCRTLSFHRLTNLERLYLGNNRFTGNLPESISNASKLTILDLTNNSFSGLVPKSLGNLGLLEILGLAGNNFSSEPSPPESSFINSLTNCTKLRALTITGIPINGTLPVSVENLSTSLQLMRAQGCGIRGTIPNGIGNLSGLVRLSFYGNHLSGSIPNTIKGLQKLQGIDVGNNKLQGSIPNDFCQLPELSGLYMAYNQLSGSVPACLGNITSLRQLNLSSNKLTSTLPASLGNLKDLLMFKADLNSFHGNIPSDIGNLKNNFSSDIPGSIGDLQNLVTLYLEHNDLMGTIPETFRSLVSLETLDLSQNNLSGLIPKSLDKLLYLKYFNVSYNKLHGEIPSGGPFRNFTSQSFLPNEALCGATQFGVRPCKTNYVGRSKTLRKVVIICVSFAISLVVVLLTFVLLWIRRQKSKRLPVEIDLQPVAEHRRISYREILEATNRFEESNLLGNGSFGSVYKGVLSDGMVVAIKVFKLQRERALKSFHVECDVIRNVRHRNLTKIITSCSNPDFKALVLEYMQNGSLEKWLYSHNYVLDILQRLDIMTNLSCVEYGLEGSVSTSCDVYSYGIMLMETFTRKKPTDEMFAGQMTLKWWVKESLPSSVIQVLDRNLLRQGSENSLAEVDCVSSILKLALDCTAESPEQRINVKDVLATLKKIRGNWSSANSISNCTSVSCSRRHKRVAALNLVNMGLSSGSPICNWIGITCSRRHKRVAALHLANMGLVGSIPPSIGNLSFLVSLDLSNNNFHGHLPDELDRLQRLEGVLPSFIGQTLANLEQLLIGGNEFTGSLPVSIPNASKLYRIDIFRLDQEKALKSFETECEVIRSILTGISRRLSLVALTLISKLWFWSTCQIGVWKKYGSEGSVSTWCDVYSYGIMLMEMLNRKTPTDDMFAGDMSLKRWVKESPPNPVFQ